MKFPNHFIKKYDENDNTVDFVSGMETTILLNLFCIYYSNVSLDIYTDFTGPLLFYNSKEAKESYKKARDRGVRIRVITEITKDNIFQCKQCLGYIDELRHMDGIKHVFGVSERHYLSSRLQYDDPKLTEGIFSNVKWFVKEQQYFFENLWKKAIPAKQRFREIDLSLKREFIETLRDSDEIIRLLPKVITSCSKELLCIIPSYQIFNRFEKEGFLRLLVDHIQNYNLDFKLIVNTNGYSNLKELCYNRLISLLYKLDASDDFDKSHSKKYTINNHKTFNIKFIQKDTTTLVFIIDKELMLSVHINNEDQSYQSIKDTIEIATYSNSASAIYPYLSVFEKLWIEKN